MAAARHASEAAEKHGEGGGSARFRSGVPGERDYDPSMAKAPILTPQADDFPRWYQDVLNKAELADNGPVRGTMVIRPYAYALWERMQRGVDDRIKATGAENAYFPLFIPLSFLEKEAEHVAGFAPELAVVTHGGGKELEEPVVVRPTSETIINHYFAKWVQSYRDLPLLLNQWCNVVRWELRPRIFLRTTEFLWQEGHTAHATQQDASAYARQILHDVYEDFWVNVMAVPVIVGRKPPSERFPGAINSMTGEAMMRDGKALQMGTSHELGQNFSRMFGTQFLDEEGQQQFAWQTSWGVTTRMVGALIMAHGDDQGLRLPPRLAPIQVVVLVVRDEDGAGEEGQRLVAALQGSGIRAEVDLRTDQSFGRRSTEWELKGVPVRVELGPRDLAEGNVTIVRRHDGSKIPVPVGEAAARVTEMLDAVHAALFDEAQAFADARTAEVSTIEEAAEAAKSGFARLPWRVLCDEVDGRTGEQRLAEDGVSVRCLVNPDGTVAETDDPGEAPDLVAIVARAY